MRPAGPFNPRDYFFNFPTSTASIIRDPLYEFLQMRVRLPYLTLYLRTHQYAISANWPGRHSRRTASEGPLALGISVSLWLIPYGHYIASGHRPGIWDDQTLQEDSRRDHASGEESTDRMSGESNVPIQIIDGDDLEQRALGCFTLARCIIAAGERSHESIREALSYLEIAEKDYATLEILRSLADVQFLVSVLYHNLDVVDERDASAMRHLGTEEAMKEAAVVVAEDWINQVWELVLDIGAALAKR
jgi:anaphase-promoting complex subunit 5